jgi:hypothetical protein
VIEVRMTRAQPVELEVSRVGIIDVVVAPGTWFGGDRVPLVVGHRLAGEVA